MPINAQQAARIQNDNGFIAALDQSGGSTPKTLKHYGISEDAYASEAEMFALMHAMRARVITAPAFNGDKILGAILFEKTMDSDVKGLRTPAYLWEKLNIVPFLKVDKGLEEEKDGVQMMKPIPGLNALLERAAAAGVFGTKMRSVIGKASASGIAKVVEQQFEVAETILSHGLIPIIEPEVTINIPDKQACEDILKAEILKNLAALPKDQKVMLKLTIPERPNHYLELVKHPQVLRVVALSGGYALEDACARLSKNAGMIASFSRALTNDLRAQQSDADFNAALQAVIDKIYAASISGDEKIRAA